MAVSMMAAFSWRQGPCDTGCRVVAAARPIADETPSPARGAGVQSEELTMVDGDHETAEEIVTHVKIEYCPS